MHSSLLLTGSLLVTGPAASGKSRAALERFLGIPESILLTPTATMAEHLRHELARAGVAVRPSQIDTLAGFVDEWAGIDAAPRPVLHLLIAEALERLPLPRLAGVAAFRGFHAAVATLLDELPPGLDELPAGASAIGGKFGVELARIRHEVEAGLAARGLALRNARLNAAAARVGDATTLGFAHVVLDGFFNFSTAELRLIEAIAGRVTVTVTLPDWPGASAGHERLVELGFEHRQLGAIRRQPRKVLFSTPTMDAECEEIARRILEQSARGRRFREMGVILRSRDPYAAALETTFARFGIPARGYFLNPVESHSAIRFLVGVASALLGGWDHAALLELIRMPSSGLGATPEGDAFDFALREALPGAGLPLRISGPQPALVERLAQLNAWRRERIAAQDWADCLTLLPAQLGVASSTDVLEAWTTVLDGAAAALGSSSPIALEMFWPQVQLGLALEELRVPDRRRDVVHVMDAYEARQWELPVVFVCGMVERHFPQYHREDPLLGDAARRRAGMPTSEDRQSEEKLLFELAMSRATEEVAVSYSRFNDKGEELLRSFFLGDAEAQKCETRVRPRATRPVTATPHAAIHDAALLTKIAGMHKTLSATSLESFVQCPFQFFGSKTLRLRERPAAPRDRLDVLVQGSILHRTLAELAGAPLLGAELLNAVFSEECRRARVPSTYRTEAVRLEMLRNLEAYLKDGTVKLGWDIRVEEKFQFTLSPQLDIRGRIDRLEISPRNAAVVIDYKYSAGNKIRERVDESAGGHLVQAGVYLLAAERSFGLEPAGMFFCGLKNPVTWDGWHTGIAGLERVGESTSPQVLRELMDNAAEAALKAAQEIGAGRIEPKPRDSDKCRWCEYRDICRIEEAPVARGAAGAAQD